MAKYFSDIGEQAIELFAVRPMRREEFKQKFPTVKGMKYDSLAYWVGIEKSGDSTVLPVTRIIDYKKNPSKHECNARCMTGSRTGSCECSCGGKNHRRYA